ncbi:MAG: DUF4350 domain-containing protein [Desulfobacterales bacterium]|nr:DUF4350 domain-containing protein [Desulfobacterales bacterium]
MPKANRIIVVLGLAAALLFAGGLNHLFRLRFEAGDIYPPYSSLRTDPLGTRALYESLARMPNLVVTRHFTNPERLPPPEGTTLILAGLERQLPAGDDRGIQALKRFVVSGGRAVLMLKAVQPRDAADGDDDRAPCVREGDPSNAKETSGEATPPTWGNGLGASWGYALETPALVAATRKAQRDPSASAELPDAVAWHSGVVLVAQHPDWQVRYRLDGRPVIMERRLGNGSIVLGTDSYLLSNEALRNHRQAGLLSWMTGAGRRVVFDETHFGIQHRPGVSSLIRRYRLHGLIAGLVLWTLLYIWRNNRPFPPVPKGRSQRDFQLACQDADSALVDLIGRHLPDDRLLAVCVREHEKSLRRPGVDTDARLVRIKRLASAAGHDPVATYQTICRILARRSSP